MSVNETLAGVRILVVEDEPDLCTLFQYILEREGCEVACACNGREGLEALPAFGPDVVLLNYLMPFMDGLEVLRRLREAPPKKSAKIVFYSASADHVFLEAYALGAHRVLSTPFDVKAMLGMIADALRAPDRPARDPALGPLRAAWAGKKVFVSGSVGSRDSLRALFAEVGMKVVSAGSDVEALRVLRGSQPDFILLDLGWPPQGLNFMRIIRCDPRIPRVPIVVLSNSCFGNGVSVAALRRGAADVLVKPFDPGRLYQALEKARSELPPARAEGSIRPLLRELAFALHRARTCDCGMRFTSFLHGASDWIGECLDHPGLPAAGPTRAALAGMAARIAAFDHGGYDREDPASRAPIRDRLAAGLTDLLRSAIEREGDEALLIESRHPLWDYCASTLGMLDHADGESARDALVWDEIGRTGRRRIVLKDEKAFFWHLGCSVRIAVTSLESLIDRRAEADGEFLDAAEIRRRADALRAAAREPGGCWPELAGLEVRNLGRAPARLFLGRGLFRLWLAEGAAASEPDDSTSLNLHIPRRRDEEVVAAGRAGEKGEAPADSRDPGSGWELREGGRVYRCDPGIIRPGAAAHCLLAFAPGSGLSRAVRADLRLDRKVIRVKPRVYMPDLSRFTELR